MDVTDFIRIIEKSRQSSVRNYGDVKVSSFDCGCVVAYLVGEPGVGFHNICAEHKRMKNEMNAYSSPRK